jgi:hypothetical protein
MLDTPRTPRDTALDLVRRMTRDRQQIPGNSAADPWTVLAAIRSLAAVRGNDPGSHAAITWEPANRAANLVPPGTTRDDSFAASPLAIHPATIVPPSLQSAAIWSAGASPDPTTTTNYGPGEYRPPIDPSTWPVKPGGDRIPMDEQSPMVLGPDGTWTVVREPQPAGSEAESPPYPSIFFPKPPASKPAPPPMPEPSMPPGSPRPDAGSSQPAAGAKKPNRTPVQVLVEAIPKVLKEELQKIAGQARRELRDYRIVQAQGGWSRR